ncbi:aldehyde dehydrogenase family protein [Streptomyces sp. NPDC047009]|uniref:aldehyde dehydrogenase family protein n=1 Tax=unclassified Streptomyces TaxID=2593676 RepID=UPI0033E3F83E
MNNPSLASADTTAGELESILSAAQEAASALRDSTGSERASWLRAVGAAIDEERAELLDLAAAESHLDRTALDGEVNRTAFQLEHHAEAAESGELLRILAEPADADYPVAARPDLVQSMMPLGPVLVFTASNFPFAFSVAGNDFASALAAGCPVVVKANPGHPALSALTAEIVATALAKAGAPKGTFAHIQGVEPGVAALRDTRIKACGFTGSLAGGRALFDIAVGRPDPIPFYGELGSLNPVFVTPAAAAARAEEIAAQFAASVSFRGGQLCTKPGVLIAPENSGILDAAATALAGLEPATLLTDRITSAYTEGTTSLSALPGARVVAGSGGTSPTLVSIPPASVLAGAAGGIEECFGPAAVVIEYRDTAEIGAIARSLGPSLTATIHGEPADAVAASLVDQLSSLAGRVIWNGWPTGVSVTRALHHGGPFPATTSPTYGSIGAGSAQRWLRPVTYQNWPVELLPREVRARVLPAAE